MRRIIGFAVLLFCAAVYVASSVEDWTVKISGYKYQPTSWVKADRYRYGDLYGMSYLSKFKSFNDATKPATPANTNNHPINLYAICDSYVWAFLDSAKYYYGVDKLNIIKTNDNEILKTKLDTAKTNVLLLEFSERNILGLLKNSAYIKKLLNTGTPEKTHATAKSQLSAHQSAINFKREAIATIFNKKINSNIELNIWDYSFFTPIKEIRADVNYKLFGIVNKDVYMDKNGKQLYYAKTIDTISNTSSFKNLSKSDLDTVINRLNYLYNQGKKNKFDKIYLSIIPNPVSILDPNFDHLRYNHLVTAIQSSPKLQIPYIDIVADFEKKKYRVFKKADTHWNFYGANIWLRKFNTQLQKTTAE